MPRQKKAQNEIRKTVVTCVLTTEEKRAFVRLCDRLGYTNSTALRRLVLRELGRIDSAPLANMGGDAQ